LDIVYLPIDIAASFVDLSKMEKSKRVRPFRDYVVCSVVVNKNGTFMPHPCYAETDALD